MRLILCTVFSIMLLVSQGQSVQSVSSGNWSSTSTWQGGVVPGASDDVIIKSNHVVVVDLSSSGDIFSLCHDLNVEINGELRLGYNGNDLEKKFGITGNIQCDGTIYAGRNVPADIYSGEGLIYDYNSSIVMQLTEPVTLISSK